MNSSVCPISILYLIHKGIFFNSYVLIIFPVSVSHNLILLSKDVLKNWVPSKEKLISLTPLEWPKYVWMHFLWLKTSHILILRSWLHERSKWPYFGKNWIRWTNLLWPLYVYFNFLGMKQLCSAFFNSEGGYMKLRPI